MGSIENDKRGYRQRRGQKPKQKKESAKSLNHALSPFKLPENPKGIKGLAQILNYCLYQKILKEEAQGIEDPPEKLTRVTRKL